ncbi:Ig-like domain repeat protein, partial [Cohnella suwonensis]
YKAYVIVKDAAGNVSAVSTLSFTTADETEPTLSGISASGTTGMGTTLNFTSNEAGTYYYLVYSAADSAPNASIIEAQGIAVAKGTAAATAAAITVNVTGLAEVTAYKAYVIVKDAAGNVSAVSPLSFTTADETEPTLSATSASGTTGTGTTLNFTSNEAGTYYYLVYAAADSAPNASIIEAQGIAVAKGTAAATAAANTVNVTGLAEVTAYKAYVIVKDAAGNVSAVSTLSFTTADETAPTLSGISESGTTSYSTTLNFTSNEAGTYYYVAYTYPDPVPNAATIKDQGTAVAKGTGAASARMNAVYITGFIPETYYYVYVIVKDVAGNVSAVGSIIVWAIP